MTDTELQPAAPDLPPGWTAAGPYFKDADHYLSCDGDNPEAPAPGYGWPLGSECWYYVLTKEGRGLRLRPAGLTRESASRRAEQLARQYEDVPRTSPEPEPVTEYALVAAGGWYLRPDEPAAERAYPLEQWITDKRGDGAKVVRRRIIVVEDWEEVTRP